LAAIFMVNEWQRKRLLVRERLKPLVQARASRYPKFSTGASTSAGSNATISLGSLVRPAPKPERAAVQELWAKLIPSRQGSSLVSGCGSVMSRTYNIFGNIEGTLPVLRVECTRCIRLSHSNNEGGLDIRRQPAA
jgi:hypothetical protein